jgi:hypothetical protein
MKLESWLYSIPRSRTCSGSSRVECLGPLEMEKMSFSTRRVEWPRERAVETVWVFIELSQETSRWAQIQNLNNVRWERTLSS